MSFSGLLKLSWALYRANFGSLVILFLPLGAALSVVIAPFEPGISPTAVVALAYALAVLQVVIGGMAVGTAALLVTDRSIGQASTATDAFRKARPHLGPLLAAGLASSLLSIVLLQLLGPLAFFIHPLLYGPAIVGQVIALEGLDLKAGLARARALLRGEQLRIFMYLFTVALGVNLFNGLVLTAASIGLSYIANDALGFTVATLAQIVVAAVIVPFIAVAMLVAYFDLRARKEGFGPAELQAEREVPG
ncbi:MAG: hypothetical protein M3P18_10445 [Actinomycetota bacterium]|nr:hypothetical protein [Actinomycetota bacterium]